MFEHCANNDELTFVYKWGMDGASGQSQYKQIFNDSLEKVSDASIIMISLVPLRILYASAVLWQNHQSSSTKYCRPIKFLFDKESKEIVKREFNSVRNKINALTSSSLEVKGRQLFAKHELIMTMVDGKLINEVTDCSSSNCNICGAKPSQMNNFRLIEKRACNEHVFAFGVSSLHCWILFLKCMLKIAYRLQIKKWKAKGHEKAVVKANKERIQGIFRIEKGISFWTYTRRP